MPLYDLRCETCNNTIEVFLKRKLTDRTDIPCAECQSMMVRIPSLIAKTPDAWGTNWRDGLTGSGVYSSALGRTVSSRRQERQLLEQKGFVAESELGNHWYDDTVSTLQAKQRKADQYFDKYNQILTETGDSTLACSEAFPASECLDGTIDTILDTTIKL